MRPLSRYVITFLLLLLVFIVTSQTNWSPSVIFFHNTTGVAGYDNGTAIVPLVENNLKNPMNLTSPEQTQARSNIGAASLLELTGKQNLLTCGTTLKTVNSECLLGSGNIDIASGAQGPEGPEGPTGAQGPIGLTGPGLPVGGTAGQLLRKVNSTDYNLEFFTPDYAAAVHVHSVGNVTGLQALLDGKAAISHTHTTSEITDFNTAADSRVTSGVNAHVGLSDPHTQYQLEGEKGAASGYAPLNSSSLVPIANLSTGTCDTTSVIRGNQTCSAVGTNLISNDSVTNAKTSDMAQNTIKCRASSGSGDPEDCTTTNIKGFLTYSKSDVGLSNVDNTSDSSKPISTATQAALDLKIPDPTLPTSPPSPKDDFFSQSTETGEVGELGWTFTNGSIQPSGPEVNHPTVLIRRSGTVISQVSSMYTSSGQTSNLLRFDQLDYSYLVFRLVATDADFAFRAGFTSDCSTTTPVHGLYIERTESDSGFFGVVRNNSNQSRTGVALTAHDTSWHTFRMRRVSAGSVGFMIDSNSEVILTSSNVPDPGDSFNYCIQIVPTTMVARDVILDFFSAKQLPQSR